jgi:hypothetical protein
LRLCFFDERSPKFSGSSSADVSGEVVFGGLFYTFETAKFAQEFHRSLLADAGDAGKFGREARGVASRAMEGDGEAVRLIADLLYQM